MYYSSSNKETQLQFYSLFLLSDGKWTLEEEKYLDDICKKMKIGDDTKKKIITYCQSLQLNEDDNSERVIHEMDQALSGMFFFPEIKYSKKKQIEVIWTMLNLGYADREYSIPEKKVVQHLIKKWEVKPVIVSELIDTADTILLLTRQKEWLKTTGLPYDEIGERINVVERKIQLMFDNIKVTIAEAEAV